MWPIIVENVWSRTCTMAKLNKNVIDTKLIILLNILGSILGYDDAIFSGYGNRSRQHSVERNHKQWERKNHMKKGYFASQKK